MRGINIFSTFLTVINFSISIPIKYKIFSRRKPKRFLISLKYYNQKLPLPCQINVQNSDKCSFPNSDLCKLNFYKKKLSLKFHFCKF